MARSGVLLLHGHGRTGLSMRPLARRLEASGLRTTAPTYLTLRRTLPEIVEQILPRVAAFQRDSDGPLHIVTHSMGGLVARALIQTERPANLGRVIMLAPPNGGSEWADLLYRLNMHPMILGAAGPYLKTARSEGEEAVLGPVDFELGIIAGTRPIDPFTPALVLPAPHDGKVSVASTRLPGMTDHIALPVSHNGVLNSAKVARQVEEFLRTGHFDHG